MEPAQGGETPILLSYELYNRAYQANPEFMDKLERGVTYQRVLSEEDDPTSPIGRGWKSTFLTQDRAEAEAKQTKQGGQFEWMPDGTMKIISAVLPAVRTDDRTGKKTFFNSYVILLQPSLDLNS